MITFKEFLAEGGWGSTITQNTKLTPAIAKKAVAVLPQFEHDFNEFLKHLHMAPIKIGKPVGSSAYIDRDIKDAPDREYGDIDVIMIMPRLDGFTESKNNSVYRDALATFTKTKTPAYMYPDESTTGHHVIVKVGDAWIQVDLVTAFSDVVEWTTARMTPEHNVKGALMGFLYASIAEVLHMQISGSGVQSKEIGGEMVPFTKIKVDKTSTVSSSIGTFMLDLLKHFHSRAGDGPLKVHPLLVAHPGMKSDHIQMKDLIAATKGLGKSLEMNGLFGKKDLKRFTSYDDYISEIKKAYQAKVDKAVTASKFNKAATDDAIARANATKTTILDKSKEILSQL